MTPRDFEAMTDLSPKRKKLFVELAELNERINEELHEFSRSMKEAEASGWSDEQTRRADQVFDQGVRLHRQYSAVLDQLEGDLSDEEKATLDEIERRSKFRLDEQSRFLREELAPSRIPADQTLSIEDSLEKGLDELLNCLPSGWLREQATRLAAAGDSYLRQPLILAAGMVDTRPELQVHPYAYGLLLAQASLAKQDAYDIYQGSLLVPCISALCEHLDGIRRVKGGTAKLQELPKAPPEETLSRIFELLVSGRAAKMGRDVELLQATSVKTPDIRIHGLPFPAVAECKKQSRLSASERAERDWVRELFRRLAQERVKHGLVGQLNIQLNRTVEVLAIDTVENAVFECVRGINPFSTNNYEWGHVSFAPLPVSVDLTTETRIYSPFFLRDVFGWDTNNCEYDGICAVVSNNSSVRLGRAELPFCLQWRIDAKDSIERKARSIVSALAEAIDQIPVGEGSFVYISYDESRRPSIANRRTEKVKEVAKTFRVRKRGTRPPLMIVIDRLYPSALEEGRPDLVESAIPLSPDEDLYWANLMPTRIFV